MDTIGDESIGVREHGFEKYRAEGLIASSVGLGWSGLSAALLSHGRGVIEYQGALSQAELCVAICPSNSLVTRLIGGVVDRTIAERGTIWLCPPGPEEVLLDIAAPVQVLHMHLPARHFSAESLKWADPWSSGTHDFEPEIQERLRELHATRSRN